MRVSLAGILLLAATAARAQLVESIEVRITNIDVVVTDRAGKPVSGLTQDDFELYENGKKQTITNFYAVERSATAIAAAPATTETPAPVVTPPERRRRIVFFIDNFTLDPMQRRKFTDVLDKEIEHIVQPGDEATIIVFNRRAMGVPPFTGDAAALKTALRAQVRDAGVGMLATSRKIVQSQVNTLIDAARSDTRHVGLYYQQALSVVRAWAEQSYSDGRNLLHGLSATVSRLAGMDGKKVLVFATGSLPEKAGVDMFEYLEQNFRVLIPNLPTTARLTANGYSITTDIEKLAKQANTDGVTMYLVDASGAVKGSVSAENSEPSDITLEAMDKMNTGGALQLIAKITGGTAVTGTDNFQFAFDTLARDLDTYYSLGYRSEENDKTGNRNVRVKVLKPGLSVRSRRSWAPKTQVEQMHDRVIANLFRENTTGAFAIEVALRGEPQKRGRGVFRLPLRVTIPSTITMLPDGPDLAGGFAVFLVVGNGIGDMSSVISSEHPVRVPAVHEKVLRANPLIYDIDIEVREGKQTVSIAVVDKVTNEAGFTRREFDAR